MSVVDFDRLLKEISPKAPSGAKDLAYEPIFIDLQEKIDQIDGKKPVKNDKMPKWPEIQEDAVDLLTQTHDLRVAVFLTRALLHNSGLIGLRDGLSLIHGLIQQYWDTLYPVPEDKEDPLERINALDPLCDWEIIIAPLMKTALCESRVTGCFNLRDIRIATDQKEGLILTEEEKKAPPTLATIEAAFSTCELADVQATADAIHASSQRIHQLKTVLEQKLGSADAPHFEKLSHVLDEMEAFLEKRLGPRPPADQPPPKQEAEIEKTEANEQSQPDEIVSTRTETPSPGIHNRHDVTRVLDEVCTYYARNEPGSPVPLLLKRARNLVEKNFFEIVEDLAPDSVAQIKKSLSGAADDAS